MPVRSVPMKLFLGHLCLHRLVQDMVSTPVLHMLCQELLCTFPGLVVCSFCGLPWTFSSSELLDTKSSTWWSLPQYGSKALKKWFVSWTGWLF